jgi:hypothetical protein
MLCCAAVPAGPSAGFAGQIFDTISSTDFIFIGNDLSLVTADLSLTGSGTSKIFVTGVAALGLNAGSPSAAFNMDICYKVGAGPVVSDGSWLAYLGGGVRYI